MKIDLSQVSHNNKLLIDETLTIDQKYYEDTDIRALNNIAAKGSIKLNDDTDYSLELNITGEMILPCSITLVDVKYPFNIEIEETISKNNEENEDYLKIIDNTLDIMPIIWQNIVVEIPLRVVSPDLDNAKLEGTGWKLLTEEEKMRELDPRFEKLRDLLDD